MEKKTLYGLIGIMVCGTLMVVNNVSKGYTDYSEKIIYFLFTFLLISICSGKAKEVENLLHREKILMDIIIVLWNVLVLFSLLNPNYYKAVGSSWGASKYFFSYTVSGGMRLGSIAFCVLVFITYQWLKYRKSVYLVMMIIPIITILLSGNRGCMIMAIALLAYIWYNMLNNENLFLLSCFAGAPILFLGLMNSKFGEKTVSSLHQVDETASWFDKITNYRFRFIEIGVDVYNKYPLVNKLFGGGSESLERLANTSSLDDVTDILLVFGILGLIIYVGLIYRWIKGIHRSKNPWYIKCILYGCYALVAFSHLFYHSTNLVIAIGILGIILVQNHHEGEKKDEKIDSVQYVLPVTGSNTTKKHFVSKG